jgi:hypothetical protein
MRHALRRRYGHMAPAWQVGPFRFVFYVSDYGEPPHVHVEHDKGRAKFWLDPVELVYVRKMTATMIRQATAYVKDNEQEALEKWHAFFSTRRP